MDSLCILGRQPQLGIAELESLYGPSDISLIDNIAILNISPDDIQFDRLGGCTKLCKVIKTIHSIQLEDIQTALEEESQNFGHTVTSGKIQLGISMYGFSVSTKQVLGLSLALKKALKNTGKSVRAVPNQTPELTTAQITHNQLTGPNGLEFVVVKANKKTVIAQTIKVQDIKSYTVRDRLRPKRDSRIGMLPPKLAQMIINLASGGYDTTAPSMAIPTVLDPFCGTGVIIQESLLMGFNGYGTDLNPRMIEYSTTNLDWLKNRYKIHNIKTEFCVGDATSFSWEKPIDFVASETYLGRPFTYKPNTEILNQTINDCNTIIRQFLVNMHAQLEPQTRLCLAVPAWQVSPNHFTHLPLLDQLEELGYNRIRFEHTSTKDLIYFRPEQFVARELLVLLRK